MDEESEKASIKDKGFLQAYKTVLNSKAIEESLVSEKDLNFPSISFPIMLTQYFIIPSLNRSS